MTHEQQIAVDVAVMALIVFVALTLALVTYLGIASLEAQRQIDIAIYGGVL